MLLLIVFMATTLLSCGHDTMPDDVITQNDNYTVGIDKVVEGKWEAKALSGTHLVTNYSPVLSDSIPSVIKVRLAINGHDNELKPGQYHYIDVTSSDNVIKACEPDPRHYSRPNKIPRPNEIRLKVDIDAIKKSFNDKGYFVTPTHDTIYSQDYKGVWITADVAPIDFDVSQSSMHDELLVDSMPGENNIHEVILHMAIIPKSVVGEWKINAPSANYPTYSSKQPLMDVIYNMSTQELDRSHVASGDNFMVAQNCYAISLALSYLEPKKSIEALRAMVRDSVITCGDSIESYNSLANKMIWADAAWNVYCVTGDKEWLKEAYAIITKNISIIENSGIINAETKLVNACCPYILSNINQYYPSWASITDIFESSPLFANIILEHSYRIAKLMCEEMDITDFSNKAESIKDAINQRLWDEYKGFYSQYLYAGTLNIKSPKADNLGQALCILWDIAEDDRAEKLINEMHLTNYGIPLTYPINGDIKPELNNAAMPMVQAVWNLAAARNGNMAMLRRGIGAQLRSQALSASCNVACSATNGQFIDTSFPRGNATGNLAIFYKVIAGMNFLPNGIEFNPKVPVCFSGEKKITGFKYRNAILDITIKGSGNDLSKITLDGNKLADNFIDGNIIGHHKIVITMNDIDSGSGKIAVAKNLYYMPETPLWQWDGYYGTTYNFNKNDGYKILINDVPSYSMRDSVLGTRDTVRYRSFSLMAVNKYGFSYISKPHFITTAAQYYSFATHNQQHIFNMAVPSNYKHSFINLSDSDSWVSIPVDVDETGDYVIDVLYSNGNPRAWINSPCHMLEVTANGHLQGIIATPQQGEGQWLSTSYSSRLNVRLLKGKNTIEMRVHRSPTPNSQPFHILLSHLRIIKRNTES